MISVITHIRIIQTRRRCDCEKYSRRFTYWFPTRLWNIRRQCSISIYFLKYVVRIYVLVLLIMRKLWTKSNITNEYECFRISKSIYHRKPKLKKKTKVQVRIEYVSTDHIKIQGVKNITTNSVLILIKY